MHLNYPIDTYRKCLLIIEKRQLTVIRRGMPTMFFGGCGKKVKEPVTVTLCHVYGGLRSGRQYKTGNINKNYVQMIQVKSELYLVYSR